MEDSHEKAPLGAGLGGERSSLAWLSDLEVSDSESISVIAFRLAPECHDLALSRGFLSYAVEDHLPLVFGVLEGNLHNLISAVPVVTSGTSDIAGVRIGFDPVGYRLAADSACERVANAINRDGNRLS